MQRKYKDYVTEEMKQVYRNFIEREGLQDCSKYREFILDCGEATPCVEQIISNIETVRDLMKVDFNDDIDVNGQYEDYPHRLYTVLTDRFGIQGVLSMEAGDIDKPLLDKMVGFLNKNGVLNIDYDNLYRQVKQEAFYNFIDERPRDYDLNPIGTSNVFGNKPASLDKFKDKFSDVCSVFEDKESDNILLTFNGVIRDANKLFNHRLRLTTRYRFTEGGFKTFVMLEGSQSNMICLDSLDDSWKDLVESLYLTEGTEFDFKLI